MANVIINEAHDFGGSSKSAPPIGCPKCEAVNYPKANTMSMICNGCSEYFRVEDAVEAVDNRTYGLNKTGAVQWRHRFRDSLAHQAEDSKTGAAREKGASHYNYRQMDRYEKRTGNTRGKK